YSHLLYPHSFPTRRSSDLFNLAHEKGRASFTFIAFRCAIAWRTALNYVCDVNFLAAQSHSFDHVGQQLTGAADERLAFRRPRRSDRKSTRLNSSHVAISYA